MIDADKIFVFCPGGAATGGIELLHQLVDALRTLGRNCFICYLPINREFAKPEAYFKYNAPSAQFDDSEQNYAVIPEVALGMAYLIKRAAVGIWWLSVDNYLATRGMRSGLKRRGGPEYWFKAVLPLIGLKKCDHFAQSHYARQFLSDYGISSYPLTDYLNESHTSTGQQVQQREDIIAYNPRKGMEKTIRIIARWQNLRFIPIENMNADEVHNLLTRAKIYMDFGQHPGKDRLPREAALAGCCILTGRQGACRNAEDVPIAESYKLDDDTELYVEQFGPIAEDILQHFDKHHAQFAHYRKMIKIERATFSQQVEALFAEPPTGRTARSTDGQFTVLRHALRLVARLKTNCHGF